MIKWILLIIILGLLLWVGLPALGVFAAQGPLSSITNIFSDLLADKKLDSTPYIWVEDIEITGTEKNGSVLVKILLDCDPKSPRDTFFSVSLQSGKYWYGTQMILTTREGPPLRPRERLLDFYVPKDSPAFDKGKGFSVVILER